MNNLKALVCTYFNIMDIYGRILRYKNIIWVDISKLTRYNDDKCSQLKKNQRNQ